MAIKPFIKYQNIFSIKTLQMSNTCGIIVTKDFEHVFLLLGGIKCQIMIMKKSFTKCLRGYAILSTGNGYIHI